jgi:14-3-3 protein epsilon
MACVESQFKLADFENSWSEDKRKDLVFLARTAEAAERYDDMCKCMSELVNCCKGEGMTVDERNLLSVAYKNVIGARRASWRTLNAESQDEKNSSLIEKYKSQVEEELKQICNNVLDLLKNSLIDQTVIDAIHAKGTSDSDDSKSSPEGEAQVFYLKMAGDYYRYLAEAVTDQEHEKKAAEYYKQAFELSEKVLEPTHPIRLGLALNYSVCFYEILKDKKKACQLAKDAFDEAISKLDKLEEADYKDSTLIMQLLRDNLTLWTSTDEDDNQEEDGGGD